LNTSHRIQPCTSCLYTCLCHQAV